VEFNLAQIHEAVEAVGPDRECFVFRDRRFTYRQFGDRTRRLANHLLAAGLGKVTDRATLAGHESGQDHLAIYLHNGNEYLESMFGAYKARLAPFNVNYRYVAEELLYLLNDSGAKAIVYHSAFAPTLEEVRAELPDLQVLVQVPDESGTELLADAVWYEDALADQHTSLDPELVASWSPDDLYILYTGGTTGMPKGVLWRQADIYVGALGGRRLDTGGEYETMADLEANAANGGARLMPGPPFMHGAAHWLALRAISEANTIVLPNQVDRFDPVDMLSVIDAEAVNVALIVGDAFGRPLVEEIERGDWSLSSLLMVVSGGAALSAGVKDRLLAANPSMMVLDGLGSSETGQQATQLTAAGQEASTGDFAPGPGMCILSEDLSRVLEPGAGGDQPDGDADGWLGQAGRVPLGYLGDAAKTARTFPVIDGVRYSVPGDRARLTAEGKLLLFGRDSVTINSGGEKIFAEEVEAAILHHPAVFDCVVAGRPSERWGNEVVAVVQFAEGATATDDELLEAASHHVARYKLPKAIVVRDAIVRSPAGKADYRWAKAQAEAG